MAKKFVLFFYTSRKKYHKKDFSHIISFQGDMKDAGRRINVRRAR
jgi:hypothetical protein